MVRGEGEGGEEGGEEGAEGVQLWGGVIRVLVGGGKEGGWGRGMGGEGGGRGSILLRVVLVIGRGRR